VARESLWRAAELLDGHPVVMRVVLPVPSGGARAAMA
jgi:hypothetical protein